MRSVALLLLLALRVAEAASCASRWESRAPMGIPRQEIGVTAIGATLYAIGGFDAGGATAAVEAYDTVTDQWRTLAPLPRALHHVGAAAVGGRVYAVGGLAGGAFTAVGDVYAYDPGSNAWSARAPLPAPRGAMGIAVVGGRIYAAGGARGASVADFAAYDPATNEWTPLPDMPTARDHLGAAEVGGTFYAAGGRFGQLFGALEAFDPAAGSWRSLAPMPTPRGGLMVAGLGGRVFAFGGEGNGTRVDGIFPETEVYDVALDRWAGLTPMQTPRHGTAAVTIGDGIYIPGGATQEGFGISAVTEVFFPGTGSPLAISRARLRAGRLRVRGRIDGPPADLGQALVLRALDGDAELAAFSLPAGSLTGDRRGRRFRYRDPAASAGFTRVVLLRRANGSLAVKLDAVTADLAALAASASFALEVGSESFCGAAPQSRATGD